MPGKHDDTLFKLATRIQARAMQRVGELLKEIKPAKNQHASRPIAGRRRPQLNRAALSDRQRCSQIATPSIHCPNGVVRHCLVLLG
jgi:hypothetical protein